MNTLKFKKNKKSKTKGIFMSSFVIVLSLVVLFFGLVGLSPVIMIIYCGFLFLGVYLLTKALSNKETVVVDTDGIVTKVNGAGLIHWKFIKGFELKKIGRINFLVVLLKDDKGYLETVSQVKRSIMKTNIKRLGSPIAIPQSEFHLPLEEVKENLEAFKQQL